MKIKTVICDKCNGSGMLTDQRWLGASMRAERIMAKLFLSEVANRMGISQPYLSDLERGRRDWNPELEKRFREALKK